MWKKYPENSGFYWYCYGKENKVVCQYEKLSGLVLFPGGGFDGIPIKHLDEINGLWYGPLKCPDGQPAGSQNGADPD